MEKSIEYQNIIGNVNQIKDSNELKELHHLIADRWKELSRRKNTDAKLSFRIGDKVKIKEKNLKGKADRHLRNVIGTIKKLNPTKAVVLFEGTKWTIPYNMIIQA